MKKLVTVGIILMGIFMMYQGAEAFIEDYGAVTPLAYVCSGNMFTDVNDAEMPSVFCGFIEEFALRGITTGCQADNPGTPENEAMFCPDSTVTRAQMAVFVTKALDLVPAGPKGDKGDTGTTGATGPQGPKGDKGDAGATGPQGPKGDKGAQGIAGADGKSIFSGTSDPADTEGNDGDFYINIVSNTLFGPKTGGAWPPGISLVGLQGPKGDKGDKGATGATGSQGPKGDTGAIGATGPQGPTGPAGPQGPKGDTGATGATGPQGEPGPAGPVGMVWQGEWDDTASYSVDDAVSYQGSSYIATQENTNKAPLNNAALWDLLASKGDPGTAGGDITKVTADWGLLGGGASGDVTLYVNPLVMQARVSGACAAGSSIRQIDGDGNVTCQNDNITTDAGDLTAGTLSDARLTTNVMRLNNSQTVTGVKTFDPALAMVPFSVGATKRGMVANLNAEMVGGKTLADLDEQFLNVAGDTMNGALSVAGTIESTSGGIKFPDTTVQTTAAAPSWHQVLPAANRFVLVMGDEAVLDRETGLVWQRDTGSTVRNWYAALSYCYSLSLGGRKGWRPPTVEELSSLVDPSQTDPALPAGHSFTNVQASYYWSSTTFAVNPDSAWVVDFGYGYVSSNDKYSGFYVRCVRAGQ